ncbi:MAG: hypothetical protein V7609_994 [Verrucomicrobiota bacterium]
MRKLGLTAIVIFLAALARANQLLPTAEGTTWLYQSTEEGGGPDAAPVVRSAIAIRAGKQMFEGKEFVKLETLADKVISKIELLTVDDRGVICAARGDRDGKIVKLDPPAMIVPAPLKVGETWDSDGQVAGMEMQQHFSVVAEEMVHVPAGAFRAFHIHAADASVMSITLDRWFVPGLGFVKETTVVRGPTGGLLQRFTLDLQKRPEVVAKPQVTPSSSPAAAPPSPTPTPPIRGPEIETLPATPGKKVAVEVSADPGGGLKTEFKSDVANIYVRWRGHGLPEGARVRVAWVAEDVGDLVEPNFIVDQTETIAAAPDASARFTLGRPPDGWAEGKYRLEFYVNDELEETIKVTIVH